jgi:pimeloyl-ACP methyl ester carboxylesterase
MEKLTRDGVALAYEEAGTGDPPFLFVHGWCGNHTSFAAQVDHFRPDHRVIAVDLRGHGASDTPQQDYTLAGFVDDLVWLCDQLGVSKPVVIGHSMGGNIALELAVRHPESVTAIIAIDSVIARTQAFRDTRQSVAAALWGPSYREAAAQLLAGLFLPTDDQERKAQIVAEATAMPQHVMASAFEQHITRYDSTAASAACRVPVLYIGAAAPKADVARFRELCPQVMVGQTVGAGHWNHLDAAEQVDAMLDRFLTIAVPHPAGSASGVDATRT